MKQQGNDCVKRQDYKRALEIYSECVNVDASQTTAYLNRALCHLKLENPSACIEDSSFVLSKEPENVKAMYRRALAYNALGRHAEAVGDLERLLVVEPKNQMARDELTRTRQEMSRLENELKEVKIKEVSGKVDQVKVEVKKDVKKRLDKFEPVKLVVPVKEYDFSSITNGYEFLQAWNSVRPNDVDNYARLLENVQPGELPKYIGSKLDDNMFSAIVRALEKIETKRGDGHSFVYLKSLTNVQRFGIIQMFMSKETKEMVGRMLDAAKSVDDVRSVKKLYGI